MHTSLPKGVFCANLTAQNADLSIDYERTVAHAKHLLENGCDGLAVMGTTGEANSFSLPERMGLLDTLVESGIPPGKIMVGTGCCALTDSVILTKHALSNDAGGILFLPPFYYKGVSDEGIIRSVSEVVNRVGERNLEMYLYHFPKMSQTPWSDEVVAHLIDQLPETVIGMKDSSGDMDHTRRIKKNFPDFRIFAGSERFLLDAKRIDAEGCVSASVNVTHKLAAEVWSTSNPDASDTLQASLTEIRSAIESLPMVPALKQLKSWQTGEDEWLHVRPPLMPLSPKDSEMLRPVMERLA